MKMLIKISTIIQMYVNKTTAIIQWKLYLNIHKYKNEL